MSTFVAQVASLAAAAPTYNVCTAADKFAAAPGAKYLLHYKNAATPTGVLKVTDQVTPIPPGSTASAGFADLQVTASLLASTEAVVEINNSSRFIDGQGFVNLVNGTPTTLTVAIIGPL
jgi:hypothetical protein